MPWLLSRLPVSYFLRAYRQEKLANRRESHPLQRLVISLLRNSVGFLVLVSGVAMLVLPGQGVLTILVGIALIDIPGKDYLLEICVRMKRVRQSLNWVRRKAGKKDFVFDDESVGRC